MIHNAVTYTKQADLLHVRNTLVRFIPKKAKQHATTQIKKLSLLDINILCILHNQYATCNDRCLPVTKKL